MSESEADRVFSSRKGQGAQATSSERRHILSTSRKGGAGGSTSRMVEVVHVRRGGTRPTEGRPQAASRETGTEAWLEGFRAKPAQPIPSLEMQPAAPKAPAPVVHVMPMWEPSRQQAPQPMEEPPESPGEAAAPGTRRPRLAKVRAPTAERHFADPFADGEDGTNCMRCGYLVEPAREKRGLTTCLACG
jgi:hypothetical protein